jgi:hypothetical protein
MVKKCTKCGIEKELEDFHKGKSKDGRQPRCKSCVKNYHKDVYYIKNKDKIIKQQKAYVLDNKLKVKQYQKEYRLKNKEKEAQRVKKWILNNPEKHTQYNKEYNLKHREKHHVQMSKIVKTRKQTVLSLCGGAICRHCGATNINFLCLDHINNDGTLDRKKHGAGHNMYRAIINGKIDTKKMQVLCYNCNQKKEMNRKRRNKSNRNTRYKNKLREQIIHAYGGKCECCENSDPDVLTIDHVFKRTSKDDLLGYELYAYLRNLGFPKQGYQLLCMNCNLAKSLCGGICPHKQIPTQEDS